MGGRTWKNISNETAEQIKSYLLDKGGEEKSVSSEHELWRVKFSDSTFTYYKSGTLYSTPSIQKDPAVYHAYKFVAQLVGSIFVGPTKDYLIGLDETGKGELAGHIHLAGVVIPRELFKTIEALVTTADTKKPHPFDYWDGLFQRISSFIKEGLTFIEEKIPPWHVDRYNINQIMDVVYQRILASFFRELDISKCRIVVDDYGIGATLHRFLNFLEKQGAEVIIAEQSDDTYLESRLASLIAKRGREAVLKAINDNPDYKLGGLSLGSGNPGDKKTVEWLKSWHTSGKDWPWFIRRSFSTVRKLEGLIGKTQKTNPPIRESLLSNDFKETLNNGKLDIKALSVVCPECGTASKAVLITGDQKRFTARCPNCKEPIQDLNFTLKYYCGFVVPDSNVINRGFLGKDLERSRFFEDFTIMIPSVVRFECDTPGGKKEFERLGRYAAIGRIKLREAGNFDPNRFKSLSTQERDDLVIQTCIDYSAILLSADKQVKGLAVARNIFTVFLP